MSISPRLLPFAVLLCALLWGSAFPGIKAIYATWAEDGIEPSFSNRLILAGVRYTLAGLILLLLARQPLKEWKQTPKGRLLWFACSQTFFQYMTFYTALSISSAALGGLLTGTGSLWWVILAPLILKTTWPSRYQWSLIGLGTVGVLIAVYRPGGGSGDPVLGGILFILSTLSGALAVIALQGIIPTMGPRAASGFGLLIGGLMLSVAGFAAWSTFADLFTPTVILWTVYLAFVSAIAFDIWNYLTTIFPVNLLAGYRFLIPICAVVESALFVKGESLGIGILLGGVLVITSIIGLQRTQKKRM